MTALRQKLGRDLRQLRAQAVAIGLVLACGVATFVMSVSVLRALERMGDDYYARNRFAQVFAQVRRAPRALVARVAALPGVAAVEVRVVAEATLDLPGMTEPAVGRLVSLPDRGEPELNRLHLRRGRWPEAERRGEILVNEAFAVAHGLEPGSRLTAVLHGRRERLTVVGVGLSPEYLYQIRAGDLVPDDRRFGVLWMRERPLAAAFDLTHAWNDLALTLARGAAEAEVIARLDALLAPYGGRGAHGRSEQVSHRYFSDELSQLRAMAYVPPGIFLLVAAFVLNVVLNRIIATQRGQIATLKAFGYTPASIGVHYLQLALLIVGLGVVLGVVAGGWLGRGLADLYVRFFRFPVPEYRVEPVVVLQAVAVSTGAGLLAVVMAIRRVVRLAPAEAMRPEAPGVYRRSLLEVLGLRRWPGPLGRMVLRQVERRPWRALLSVTGIALGIAVMILGAFGKDMVDHLIDLEFGAVQRQDFTVGFAEPLAAGALPGIARVPGVRKAEPFRVVPVRLVHGARSRRTALTGLPAGGELLRLRDQAGRPVELPAIGLLLADKLAENLGVGPGDRVRVEVLEGSRAEREVVVGAVVREFSGLAAHLEIDALHRLMEEGPVISGAWLRTDPAQEAALHARLKALPRVAAVVSQRAALRSFEVLMEENMLRMRFFNVLFASILAFGVVYNAARITLAERAWELATLRVVGMTRGEVSAVLVGELALLCGLAVPLGLVLGHGLAAVAVRALETETQRFPLVIAPATYAAAALTVLAAAAGSGLVVWRRIARLDLMAVLKSPE
jgi:putative ABC transport system permease protein